MYAPQFPAMHIGAPPPPQLVLLRFENASVTTERTEVATLCSQFGEVAYVDFRFGEQIGYVRFRRPEAARAAIDALTMYPQQVDGVVPTWRLLGIDETREYWASAKSSKAASVMNAAAAPASQGPLAPHSTPRAERGAAPRALEARPAERGLVLAFEGAEPNTDRADLNAVCNHYGVVAYIDFRFGATAGYVRFRTADGARAALGALSSGTISIGGAVPSWRMLSEEEEEQYKLAVQNKKQMRAEELRMQQQQHMQQQMGGAPHHGMPHPHGMNGFGGAGGIGLNGTNGGMMAAGGGAFASGAALEPSAVLRFEQAAAEVSRETIAEACAAHAEVAFVDFRPGTTAGYVRFRTADGARAALAALSVGADGLLVPSTWRQLSVAEANAYREEVQTAKRQHHRQFDLAAGGKGGWAGGKGGWAVSMGRGVPRGWGVAYGGGRGRGAGRIAW